jgi:hypothetical protein
MVQHVPNLPCHTQVWVRTIKFVLVLSLLFTKKVVDHVHAGGEIFFKSPLVHETLRYESVSQLKVLAKRVVAINELIFVKIGVFF